MIKSFKHKSLSTNKKLQVGQTFLSVQNRQKCLFYYTGALIFGSTKS